MTLDMENSSGQALPPVRSQARMPNQGLNIAPIDAYVKLVRAALFQRGHKSKPARLSIVSTGLAADSVPGRA